MAKKYKNIFFLFNCRVKKLIHLVKVFWLKFKVILLDQMNRKFNFAKKSIHLMKQNTGLLSKNNLTRWIEIVHQNYKKKYSYTC